MIAFLSKYRRPVFIGTVAVFLVGVFVGLGAYVFTSSSDDAVAEVGGSKIPYKRFITQVNRVMSNMKDSGTDVNDALSKTVKQEIFREMVIEELLSQQGGKIGMIVPDFEVAVEVQNTPQFREGNAFSPRAYYMAVLGQFDMSPSEYEAWRKKSRLAAKFKQFIYTSVKVTPEEAKAYCLAKNKNLKDFDKNQAKYTDELARDKFANLANYLLRQLTSRQEVKSYLDRIEKRG
ncbi:MAG: SurA N-terminal domain-containing protein [Elusimicrobiota bacterium]